MKKTFWVNVSRGLGSFYGDGSFFISKEQAHERAQLIPNYYGTYPIEIDVPEKSITITESEFDRAVDRAFGGGAGTGDGQLLGFSDRIKSKLFGKGEP